MNITDKCIIESNGVPLQQLYKMCINHLLEMNYKFKVDYENETQVLITLPNGNHIDFFQNVLPREIKPKLKKQAQEQK